MPHTAGWSVLCRAGGSSSKLAHLQGCQTGTGCMWNLWWCWGLGALVSLHVDLYKACMASLLQMSGKIISPEPKTLGSLIVWLAPQRLVHGCRQGAGVHEGVTEGFVNGASMRVEAEPCWCKGGGIHSEKKGYLWRRVVKFLGVSFSVSWAALSPSLLLFLSLSSCLLSFWELETILLPPYPAPWDLKYEMKEVRKLLVLLQVEKKMPPRTHWSLAL